MSRERKNQLYFMETEGLENVKAIQLDAEKKEDTSKEVETVILNDKEYIITEKLGNKDKVVGYVSVSKKEHKSEKVELNEIRGAISSKVAVRKQKRKKEVVAGYIKEFVEGDEDYKNDNSYIAITYKKKSIIPLIFIPIFLLAVIFITLQFRPESTPDEPDTEDTVFRDGDKGNGELGSEETDFGEQPTFRMKLNCTPTVEDNKMNIRIESPKEENADYGFTVTVYLVQKVDAEGNVLEDYSENPEQIYESPLVYADENIEYAELDKKIDTGIYVARAMYNVYDSDLNLLGQTACRLDLESK